MTGPRIASLHRLSHRPPFDLPALWHRDELARVNGFDLVAHDVGGTLYIRMPARLVLPAEAPRTIPAPSLARAGFTIGQLREMGYKVSPPAKPRAWSEP